MVYIASAVAVVFAATTFVFWALWRGERRTDRVIDGNRHLVEWEVRRLDNIRRETRQIGDNWSLRGVSVASDSEVNIDAIYKYMLSARACMEFLLGLIPEHPDAQT